MHCTYTHDRLNGSLALVVQGPMKQQIKIKLRSLKSSEHTYEKGDGPSCNNNTNGNIQCTYKNNTDILYDNKYVSHHILK